MKATLIFDLDDTLVPVTERFATEPRGALVGLLFPESLRKGAPEFLRRLVAQGHDLWIYTTSLRGHAYVYLWFRALGIRLGGIVNAQDHARHCLPGSKHPPAFGIDILIDDREGVATEGRARGFLVVRLSPDDPDWIATVSSAIADRLGNMPRRRQRSLPVDSV